MSQVYVSMVQRRAILLVGPQKNQTAHIARLYNLYKMYFPRNSTKPNALFLLGDLFGR